jgi:hypothetical protein
VAPSAPSAPPSRPPSPPQRAQRAPRPARATEPARAERRAPTNTARRRPRRLAPAEQKPRRTLIAGSALVLLGLASVGVDSSDVGAGLTLLGTLLMIFGIHTFGRLGPDTPPESPGDQDAEDAPEHVGA